MVKSLHYEQKRDTKAYIADKVAKNTKVQKGSRIK